MKTGAPLPDKDDLEIEEFDDGFLLHEELDWIYRELQAKYLEGQWEICPTTGRTHIQLKVWLYYPKSVAGLIKNCPGTNWTPVEKDNRFDYASKEETRKPGTHPEFFGTRPEKVAQRLLQKRTAR